MSNLPPLAALRVFDAVARHLNFTRAAAELAMTQSAVSYQIKILERFVGEPLFRRLPRGIALTPRGEGLAPVVATVLGTLGAAFAAARDQAAALLVITTYDTFASNLLATRIGGFQLAHSELAVRVQVSTEIVDLAGGAADVAIRTGTPGWPGLRAHELFPVRFAPFCSPDFLARHGPVSAPADLLKLPLIGPDDEWWPLWFAAARVGSRVPQQRGLFADRQQLVGRAALGGHGIALLTRAIFADEVKAGRLVQLFDVVASDGRGVYLVYPEANASRPKIRAFCHWLLADIKAIAGQGW